MQNVYFGIDAGGTKTVLWGATPDKKRDFTISDAGINLYRISKERAKEILLSLVTRAIEAFPDLRVGGICAGAAGAGTSDMPNALTPVLEREVSEALGLPFRLLNDANIALEGALEGESGLLTIVGTGSNVLGKTREGRLVNTGAWGYLIGDEGSGMAIGLAGLKAVAHAMDEQEHPLLRQLFAERLQMSNRATLLDYVYRSQRPIQHIAPLVLEAAEMGDAPAVDIIYQQANGIVAHIYRLAHRYNTQLEHQVSFIGGLYNNEFYRNQLHEILAAKLVSWAIIPAKHTPVEGAWHIAMKEFE
ncbi:MAG TPA: BadF/BadG/BcrA/BcrD ATPase family protein [Rhodothermales bacterium]|nr:hypothetical protein [Bacteroidota bacterium]HRK73900.1 BadF/BadG/BcrA/BcrD ATPase family protein [Rhodothermales bacterium]HRR08860.1 BadF/BadG/BcrA/BcrD ATPase family protein [Rhodothermales bacterium]